MKADVRFSGGLLSSPATEVTSGGWSAEKKRLLPHAASYLLVFRARNATLKIDLINPFGKQAAAAFGRIILLSAFSFPMHVPFLKSRKEVVSSL